MSNRYLTKSRFKLALECPTKLFYTNKRDYANQSSDNPFLVALSNGGFQVEELAKCYFSGGQDISKLNYDEAIIKTNELLKNDKVAIYGATVLYDNLLVRVDILLKDGNKLELIEVKAKSVKGSSEKQLLNKSGEIETNWKPYINDVAFQKYVLNNAFPNFTILSFLMLVDKTATCPTDGLNQKFKIEKDELNKTYFVNTAEISNEDLSVSLLAKINVDDLVEMIYKEDYDDNGDSLNYSDKLKAFSDSYKFDERVKPKLGKKCKNCEFNATKEEKIQGLKSGFEECFAEILDWIGEDFLEPNIFEISKLSNTDKFLEEKRVKLSQLQISDFKIIKSNKPGISTSERQWLQVEKSQNKDKTHWIDIKNLSDEMNTWTYPLHFIDFETAAPAIPFNIERSPYEGIAFQYSHHMVHANGKVEHKSEYLNVERGIFPNYHFIRNLKKDLENDQGTIFKYSNHENTYLNIIYDQLKNDSSTIIDREELCDFILEVTQSTQKDKTLRQGSRNMVDLWDLVKRYYYNPETKGSNSIKYVLPAILNSSKFLQDKYSKPIYGSKEGVKSLNFKDWTWIRFENNKVVDPYKLLPKMFADVTEDYFEKIKLEEELNNGGAAMTAYSRMQFEEIPYLERKEIEKALLKYCELDTMAMVMIYEGWKNFIDTS